MTWKNLFNLQKSCQITYIEFDSYNKNFNLTSDLISKGPAITKLYFGDEMGYIRVFDLILELYKIFKCHPPENLRVMKIL